jgi:hypothetical protein
MRGAKSAVALALMIVLPSCSTRSESRAVNSPRQTPIAAAPASVPHGMGGGPIAVEVATDDIAEARCAREARCGHIGGGHLYASKQDCLAKLATEIVDQLGSDNCPSGISPKDLAECIEASREESCDNPLDAEDRAAACSAADVCTHSHW